MKNHTQNVVRKLVPDPFTKNQNWACLWINSLKCYIGCFYCMSKWRSTKISRCWLYIKLFKKTKWDLELVSLPHFLQGLWRKIFLNLYSINWPNFIDTSWDIEQYVYCTLHKKWSFPLRISSVHVTKSERLKLKNVFTV